MFARFSADSILDLTIITVEAWVVLFSVSHFSQVIFFIRTLHMCSVYLSKMREKFKYYAARFHVMASFSPKIGRKKLGKKTIGITITLNDDNDNKNDDDCRYLLVRRRVAEKKKWIMSNLYFVYAKCLEEKKSRVIQSNRIKSIDAWVGADEWKKRKKKSKKNRIEKCNVPIYWNIELWQLVYHHGSCHQTKKRKIYLPESSHEWCSGFYWST